MKQLFQETLSVLDTAFDRLEAQVPKPQTKPWKDGFVYRYSEQTIHQAIILKMVRLISGLRASLLLLENGYVQEQGIMQRVLDELGDDIFFLSYALTNDKITELHTRYLDAFFQEEFEEHLPSIDAPQKRPMIPRKKIQGYIADMDESLAKGAGQEMSACRGKQLSRTLHKTYSGYVHAAAPHILDMYGGDPARFHLEGMLSTPRVKEHERDLWNYFYRALMAAVFAASAFGDGDCTDYVRENLKRFEEVSMTFPPERTVSDPELI